MPAAVAVVAIADRISSTAVLKVKGELKCWDSTEKLLHRTQQRMVLVRVAANTVLKRVREGSLGSLAIRDLLPRSAGG